MRKRHKTYKNVTPDPLQERRLPGERKIIRSFLLIDRSCWQKTDEEKQRLKTEKLRHKKNK